MRGIRPIFLILVLVSATAVCEEPETLQDQARKLKVGSIELDQRRQEYIEVRQAVYDGLDVSLDPILIQLSEYQPTNKRQLVTTIDILQNYGPMDWELATGARPHKSGKLVDVKVYPE